MYLACVEIAAHSEPRVVQVEFVDLEPAKVWASEESARRDDATGNAAVFETAGPLMSVVWERPRTDDGSSLAPFPGAEAGSPMMSA